MCLQKKAQFRKSLYRRESVKEVSSRAGRLWWRPSNFHQILQHLEPDIHIPVSRTDKTMLDREMTEISVTPHAEFWPPVIIFSLTVRGPL